MPTSVENKKILIIDDDISIRLTLKKLVSLCFNFKIYTSDDGVQGLGYSFILKPDLIIIDSTLPKYSGRELIDYLLTNKSFSNTPIILLNEGSNVNITEINNLSNFYQFSKLDKEFPHSLVKKINELIKDIDVNNNKGGLTNIFNKRIYKINNYLSRRIIKHSNISDIKYSSNLTNNINYSKNIFKRLGNKLNFLINQFILSIYLSIFLIIFGKKDNEENIDQRKKDLNIFRSKIYPSIGLSIGLILFVCFQISLILISVTSIAFLGTKIVNAASYTWDGGGLTNNWSDCDNWSTNICPVAADTVTFNGTSTKDSVIDASWGGSITSIVTASGYTGTITQERSVNITTSLSLSSGTYITGSQDLTIQAFLLNTGATFTASSNITTVAYNFTVNGGTFNHNNGVVAFTLGGATLNCGNILFNLVTINNTGTKIIQSNCNLPLGNNPTLNGTNNIDLSGTFTGSGTLTKPSNTLIMNTTSSLSGFASISVAGFTVSGATLDFGSYSSFVASSTLTLSSGTLTLPNNADLNGALTISGGTFNAPSGNMTLAGALTISGAPTFNHNNGTFSFDGTGNKTLSCNNVIFHNVVFSHSANTITLNSNCSFNLGTNPTIPNNVTVNGTLSGTGLLTLTAGVATLTLNSGAILTGFTELNGGGLVISGANANFSDYTSFITPTAVILNSGTLTLPNNADLNGALTIGGGTFNAPSGNMTVAGALTVTGTPTFNHNNGTVIFDGATSATLSCNNIIFNIVSFDSTGTKTVNSNCNLPLGNNPVIGKRNIVLAGTLSGTGLLNWTADNTGRTFTFNAGASLVGFSGVNYIGAIFVSGAELDWGGYTTLSMNAFNLTSGSFIAPEGLMSVFNTFNHTSGVFDSNGGTIALTGSASTTVCTGTTFNLIQITHTTGARTVTNCTLPLGNDPSLLSGLILNNSTITGSGTISSTSSITFNSGSSLTGFTGYSAGLTVAGPSLDFTGYSSFSLPSGTISLTSGSLSLPNTVDLNGALTISGGTFNAPTGNMYLSGALTISGTPTFNHNNGTIIFDGTTSATLSCNNVVFNKVDFAQTDGVKTISSNCSMPLGSNPEISSGITLNGSILGSGLLKINFTTPTRGFTLNQGGVISGFDAIEGFSFTVNTNSVADFSGLSYLTLDSGIGVSGGTFTAPPIMNIGTFSFGSGTFIHNNGTVKFIDEYHSSDSKIFMYSGETKFYNLDISELNNTSTINFLEVYSEIGGSVVVENSLILKGSSSTPLDINSFFPDNPWIIDIQGTAEVEYVDVSDSNNIGNVIQAANRNVVDSGNNTGWNFNNPTITNISISNVTLGSFTTNTKPIINFNISDPNTSDTVSYTIQIDNNSDFSSVEYEYTSTLGTQGDKSHTLTTSLSDNTYYLRIKGIDNTGGDGGYINANGNNISFGIDTTIPVGYVLINNDEINTSSRNVNLILPVQSDLSGVTEMKIGEDLALTKVSWESYSYNKEFTLSPGEGEKPVYAKFKDLAGNESLTYIDTINYKAPIESTVEEIPDENPIDSDTIETLRIRILDQNNNPLTNLTIKLLELDIELTTDDNGYVEVPNISRGEYLVLGEFNGEEFEQLILADPSISEYRIILQTQPINYGLIVVLVISLVLIIGLTITVIKKDKISKLKDRYINSIRQRKTDYSKYHLTKEKYHKRSNR